MPPRESAPPQGTSETPPISRQEHLAQLRAAQENGQYGRDRAGARFEAQRGRIPLAHEKWKELINTSITHLEDADKKQLFGSQPDYTGLPDEMASIEKDVTSIFTKLGDRSTIALERIHEHQDTLQDPEKGMAAGFAIDQVIGEWNNDVAAGYTRWQRNIRATPAWKELVEKNPAVQKVDQNIEEHFQKYLQIIPDRKANGSSAFNGALSGPRTAREIQHDSANAKLSTCGKLLATVVGGAFVSLAVISGWKDKSFGVAIAGAGVTGLLLFPKMFFQDKSGKLLEQTTATTEGTKKFRMEYGIKGEAWAKFLENLDAGTLKALQKKADFLPEAERAKIIKEEFGSGPKEIQAALVRMLAGKKESLIMLGNLIKGPENVKTTMMTLIRNDATTNDLKVGAAAAQMERETGKRVGI